jgi:uncharacterized OB-fold protein
MTKGIPIARCVACGQGYFPPPLLCARCSCANFAEERAIEAEIEETTTIRHMLGQENWQPRKIASVRTKDGLLLTVGLRVESGPGTTIELFEEDLAPFGRAK